MRIYPKIQGVVVIGAGPAGLAPLFAAASQGRLDRLLRLGVTIIERGNAPGAGGLNSCAVHSDSSAEAFLDIVMRTAEPRLLALRSHPITQALVELGKGDAPLSLVAAFLRLAGQTMCALVASSERGLVLTNTEAVSVRQGSDGSWYTRVRCASSSVQQELQSRAVICATGAYQPWSRLSQEEVAGVPLSRYLDKIVQSGSVLAHGGEACVAERLKGKPDPQIVVIGGSTSAGAASAALLRSFGVAWGQGRLTLMHRKPLRVFYESAAEALAEGYTEFTERDLCPLTGRVFRFSGFRFASRELIMSARGIGGRAPEPRLKLLPLQEENFPIARKLLDRADLIVAALGYRPRVLPVFESSSREIALAAPNATAWSVVDPCCRVLTRAGAALDNFFALGLAVGPGPGADLGGEQSFRGQINSLWMWQNVLGLRIVKQMIAAGEENSSAVIAHTVRQTLTPAPRYASPLSSLAYAGDTR